MFKLKTVLTLLVCFAALSIGALAKNGTTYAVVDVEQIAKSMKEADEADKQIRDITKFYSDSLMKMQDDFQKRVEQYQKQQAMMPADQKAKEETALKALQETVMNARQVMSDEIAKKREELLAPIRAKVKEAIESVAKAENIGLVLDKNNATVLFVDEEFDITFRVLDKMRLMKK